MQMSSKIECLTKRRITPKPGGRTINVPEALPYSILALSLRRHEGRNGDIKITHTHGKTRDSPGQGPGEEQKQFAGRVPGLHRGRAIGEASNSQNRGVAAEFFSGLGVQAPISPWWPKSENIFLYPND